MGLEKDNREIVGSDGQRLAGKVLSSVIHKVYAILKTLITKESAGKQLGEHGTKSVFGEKMCEIALLRLCKCEKMPM